MDPVGVIGGVLVASAGYAFAYRRKGRVGRVTIGADRVVLHSPADPATVVDAIAVLLAGLGSEVELDTDAEFDSTAAEAGAVPWVAHSRYDLADMLVQSTTGESAAQTLTVGSRDADASADASTLSMPALVLHGTEDLIILPEHGYDLAALIPDVRFVPLNGGVSDRVMLSVHGAPVTEPAPRSGIGRSETGGSRGRHSPGRRPGRGAKREERHWGSGPNQPLQRTAALDAGSVA